MYPRPLSLKCRGPVLAESLNVVVCGVHGRPEIGTQWKHLEVCGCRAKTLGNLSVPIPGQAILSPPSGEPCGMFAAYPVDKAVEHRRFFVRGQVSQLGDRGIERAEIVREGLPHLATKRSSSVTTADN
jgi:hypothetical protein